MQSMDKMTTTAPAPKPESIVSSNSTPQSSVVTKVTVKKESPKKKVMKSIAKTNVEVPIFLRKTYHMIDTCDPTVASWSDNGETFVVKQPTVFETKIIPQFFKHSKFSSFVRQLNFYGFRKIKFSDTIKIDAKLEAETANFWRFRHENFLRGKPELLVEIRRSNSQSVTEKEKPVPKGKTEDVTVLKTEVDTLKDRIALMTSNIDQLTSLVQNITMNEKLIKVEEVSPEIVDVNVPLGSKRKKLDSLTSIVADCVPSTSSVPVKSEMEGVEFTPGAMFPLEFPSRQDSLGSNISDEAFVDELFNAFGDSEMAGCLPDPITDNDARPSTEMISSQVGGWEKDLPQHPNAPDQQLMSRLSSALTVLPKDVQEMLVNKLIATITSSDVLKSHIDAVTSSNTDLTGDIKMDAISPFGDHSTDIAIPLAAATLTAIITQYSAVMKNKPCMKSASLPVIPIHA